MCVIIVASYSLPEMKVFQSRASWEKTSHDLTVRILSCVDTEPSIQSDNLGYFF